MGCNGNAPVRPGYAPGVILLQVRPQLNLAQAGVHTARFVHAAGAVADKISGPDKIVSSLCENYDNYLL
jgi:hypothetical protein